MSGGWLDVRPSRASIAFCLIFGKRPDVRVVDVASDVRAVAGCLSADDLRSSVGAALLYDGA